MPNCCSTTSTSKSASRKTVCPKCNSQCGQVSSTTIKLHIREPWHWHEQEERYYFCAASNCTAVYFSEEGSIIDKQSIRTTIGVKEASHDALICYCFGVTKSEAKGNPKARQFVVEQTKNKLCSCEARNPSGKCCLSDFPK